MADKKITGRLLRQPVFFHKSSSKDKSYGIVIIVKL